MSSKRRTVHRNASLLGLLAAAAFIIACSSGSDPLPPTATPEPSAEANAPATATPPAQPTRPPSPTAAATRTPVTPEAPSSDVLRILWAVTDHSGAGAVTIRFATSAPTKATVQAIGSVGLGSPVPTHASDGMADVHAISMPVLGNRDVVYNIIVLDAGKIFVEPAT